MDKCAHLKKAPEDVIPVTPGGCEECLGKGEDWRWCYVDEMAAE